MTSHRSLLALARYPDLLPPVHVHYGPGPAYKDYDYYDPASNTIYWLGGNDAYGFLHEVGHAYDYQRLDDAKRKQVEPLLGAPSHRRWWWGSWDPSVHQGQPLCEYFADAYAVAQLHRVKGWRLRRLLRRLNGQTGDTDVHG